MRNYLVIGTVILLLAAAGFMMLKKQGVQDKTQNNSGAGQKKEEVPTQGNYEFKILKKSAHYESNTPAHGVVLAGLPVNIVIDFNFDLAKPSDIKILMGGVDYGEGETEIDKNRLSMRRVMKSNSPNGLYTVEYNACWPDGSCHDGSFQFVIERSQSKDFSNKLDAKEVTIKLSQIMFDPKNIKISKGTKVTWINDDDVEHYVNSDSHPAHSYFIEQNSKALKKGDTFSMVFGQAGIYPYHCSAHASNMAGALLVE